MIVTIFIFYTKEFPLISNIMFLDVVSRKFIYVSIYGNKSNKYEDKTHLRRIYE